MFNELLTGAVSDFIVKSMGVTVRDVAQKAGVSASTVSLVLNDKPGISEATRKAVLTAAAEMGYQILSSKRVKRAGNTIRFLRIAKHGYIINRNHNVFIADYIDGLEREAREIGFSLEVLSYEGFNVEQIRNDLEHNPPAGVVVLATELNEEDIAQFRGISCPLVFMDNSSVISHFDFVDMDNEGAVYSIVSVLKEMGHRRIGLVKANYETRNFRLRQESFYNALRHFGLQSDPRFEFTVDSTYEQSQLDILEQMAGDDPLPTALFCICDVIAFGCMKALREKGLHIPDDISVIGFDDLPSAQLSDPPLTSVRVSKVRIGRRAMQLLKRRMDGGVRLPYEKVLVGSELVPRRSLGPPDEVIPPTIQIDGGVF